MPDRGKHTLKRKHIYVFSCLRSKGLSNHDVRVAMGTVFQDTRPGVGSKIGDFVEEQLGGGRTVERSCSITEMILVAS